MNYAFLILFSGNFGSCDNKKSELVTSFNKLIGATGKKTFELVTPKKEYCDKKKTSGTKL